MAPAGLKTVTAMKIKPAAHQTVINNGAPHHAPDHSASYPANKLANNPQTNLENHSASAASATMPKSGHAVALSSTIARSKAQLRKHSVTLHGHATSFSLEDAFYDLIVQIAAQNQQSLASLIAMIDDQRARSSNLSSSLRLYALDWLLSQQQ